MFDYDTIVKSLSVADAIETVEDAFCKLAEGKVDVPMPMHITDETDSAGPGDCHVKGGYVSGAATRTVKVASVSFYKSGGTAGRRRVRGDERRHRPALRHLPGEPLHDGPAHGCVCGVPSRCRRL